MQPSPLPKTPPKNRPNLWLTGRDTGILQSAHFMKVQAHKFHLMTSLSNMFMVHPAIKVGISLLFLTVLFIFKILFSNLPFLNDIFLWKFRRCKHSIMIALGNVDITVHNAQKGILWSCQKKILVCRGKLCLVINTDFVARMYVYLCNHRDTHVPGLYMQIDLPSPPCTRRQAH